MEERKLDVCYSRCQCFACQVWYDFWFVYIENLNKYSFSLGFYPIYFYKDILFSVSKYKPPALQSLTEGCDVLKNDENYPLCHTTPSNSISFIYFHSWLCEYEAVVIGTHSHLIGRPSDRQTLIEGWYRQISWLTNRCSDLETNRRIEQRK